MIKAFLFDYDGVITPGVNVKLPAERLASNVGISVDKASELIVSIWNGYSTGALTTDEMWSSIESQLGFTVNSKQRNIWHTWDELTPIPFMVDFVKELHASGYPVGLVSNVFQDTAELIRKNGGYEAFDFLVLSCEVGARKPEPLMYETALRKLDDVKPGEVMYLDDREHLTIAASKLGLHSIYVTDQVEAIKEVRQLIRT